MNSPEIKQFINEHRDLFWYSPADKKEEINKELLIETIFNYCDLDDIKRLIDILGIEQLTEIFYSLSGRKKLNYYPEMYNFFSVLIKRYAHRNTK